MRKVTTQQKTIDRRRRELESFVADQSRLPHTRAENSKEAGLAHWTHRHLKSEAPDPQIVELVEAHGGYRRDRTARTLERVVELETFVATHHRLPAGGAKDPEEASLGQWLAAHRGRRTAQAKVVEICRRYSVDAPVRYTGQQRLEQLEDFLTTHGRRPKRSPYATAEELSLAQWMSVSLASPSRARRILELMAAHGMTVGARGTRGARNIELRMEQLRSFVATHQRAPRHDGDDDEVSLYTWLRRPKRVADPEPEVRALVPEFYGPSAHERRVTQLEEFLDAHGRLPRSTGDEHGLYTWVLQHVGRLGADPKVVEMVDRHSQQASA